MDGAFPEHGHQPTRSRSPSRKRQGDSARSSVLAKPGIAPRAGPAGQTMPAPGFLGFLGEVLSSEAKTRRLGYLISRTAVAVTCILVPLVALCYIVSFNSPIQVKFAVGLGSALFITAGTVVRRSYKNRRRRHSEAIGSSYADGAASPSAGTGRAN
jgi:hypothetical protein